MTESNRVLGEEGKDWGIETLKSVLTGVGDLVRVGCRWAWKNRDLDAEVSKSLRVETVS